MEIDMSNNLFLCPGYYEEDPCDANGIPLPLNEPDTSLHFTKNAARMYENGAQLICLDQLPANCRPATQAVGSIMHFRKITSPDGKDYIPLFLHYQALTGLFGNCIHIGAVSFADVRHLCLADASIAGIVIAPGTFNQIIPREKLMTAD